MENNRNEIIEKAGRGRNNLIIMIIFTLINIVLLYTSANSYFLFSATVPFFLAIIGVALEDAAIIGVTLTLAIAVLAVYFICWLQSKKHHGWMVLALVLFILDTLFYLVLSVFIENYFGIIDFLVHIWVIFDLSMGVKYAKMKKDLPEEEEVREDEQTIQENTVTETVAEPDVKYRVLAQAEYMGMTICYRRVKRVNQLIVNGYVYDSVEMLLETAHTLRANVNGYQIEAGFNGVSLSFIDVNGERIAKKTRLY